jgi:multisubunit Na+/H+ antiporter MnhB subunit
MSSFLFSRAARGILPVAIVFAIYLLLRGHDAPGGGFIAGLVTGSAVLLHALASGRLHAPAPPRVHPAAWIGLSIAAATGLLSTAAGQGFLNHYHVDLDLSRRTTLHLSTALLFDIGVYGVVVGSMVTALAAFAPRRNA